MNFKQELLLHIINKNISDSSFRLLVALKICPTSNVSINYIAEGMSVSPTAVASSLAELEAADIITIAGGLDPDSQLIIAVINEEINYQHATIGGVYFVYNKLNNLIKIGCSADIATRVTQLKREHGSIRVLSIIENYRDSFRLEAELHDRFKIHRVYGEWFSNSKDINDYCNTLPVYPNIYNYMLYAQYFIK